MVRWTETDMRAGTRRSVRGAKYGNQITEYGGRKYHSKKEAGYARELDMLSKARVDAQRVVSWLPQVKYRLEVNGVKIADYILDFKVEYADGRVEYVDVKGVRTGEYVMKKKLMKALHDINIIEV